MAEIHYLKKIQVKNFKNKRDISDLVILFVLKNLVALRKSFGMVWNGPTQIFKSISSKMAKIDSNNPSGDTFSVPFEILQKFELGLKPHSETECILYIDR